MGDRDLSTDDHIWAIKKERKDREKYWDDANDEKMRVMVSDQIASNKLLSLPAKHTGSWLSVHGTTVTGTILAVAEFRNFNVLVIMLTSPTFKINVTVACRPFMYVARSDAETKVSQGDEDIDTI